MIRPQQDLCIVHGIAATFSVCFLPFWAKEGAGYGCSCNFGHGRLSGTEGSEMPDKYTCEDDILMRKVQIRWAIMISGACHQGSAFGLTCSPIGVIIECQDVAWSEIVKNPW